QLIDTARALGIELITEEVRSPTDFAPAFASFRAKGAEAVIIRSSPLLSGFRTELCSLSVTHKLPAIGQFREMAEAGCTASYGVKLSEMHGLAAVFTDKMPLVAPVIRICLSFTATQRNRLTSAGNDRAAGVSKR